MKVATLIGQAPACEIEPEDEDLFLSEGDEGIDLELLHLSHLNQASGGVNVDQASQGSAEWFDALSDCSDDNSNERDKINCFSLS